ncbi:thioredoxin-disulfide reductase [Enterobacteriaceae endosymbiont of Plateumaris braccata]|uniref:thioredoxin-disulfide reductase n=1 Tax=Enterobacteriaceae endosymbiont of Plateumaris braccata TaxID=2675793 RepID=UPI0014490E9A|nr:thioredoxin-disulfide reductase [Enterobacteriaceae endosymbiont of Plateumaris braccata]QJC28400.1 thioredoxin-disulfide reductase [Enterobacteriaceae endosymbiont of Plateumaris braccata]
MKNTQHTKLLILGSGPAGYTAAIYSARANLKPILITGIDIGGQLMKTTNIENWPGSFPSISSKKLMNNLYNHALSFKTNIINDYIIKVNFKKKPFCLTGNFFNYTCDSLIIATGATPKFLGLNSEKKFIGKGISSCAICDGSFYYNKKIAVVGGGNTAIEEALYLSNIASEVHVIHRKSFFSAEKILINKLLEKVKNNNIKLHYPYIVKEILGNKSGVTGIKIFSLKNTENYKIINLYGIFISIGTIPNTNLFKNSLKLDNDGYIITNNISKNNFNSTQTNIKGIFAAGDVMDNVYRQAITSAATGCMAALDAQNYLRKNF